MLAALADALCLSVDERIQIRRAAKAAGGDALRLCVAVQPPARSVRPTVRALLA